MTLKHKIWQNGTLIHVRGFPINIHSHLFKTFIFRHIRSRAILNKILELQKKAIRAIAWQNIMLTLLLSL